jgi:heme exporter protein D
MPDLGPHAIFILAAYGVTFVAVAALAFAIVEDDRKQRRLLAELEQRGIRRRSAQPKSASTNPASTKPPSTKPKPKRKAAP